MDYFKFKAHEMMLLRKEDCEWQNFSKQIAPDCAACLAEKEDFKKSKDVGIQASSEKRNNELRKTTFKSKQNSEQILDSLNDIKSRLENICFISSEINNVSSKDEKKKCKAICSSDGENKLKSLEEQRKLFIQNSLKASLVKLQRTSSETCKKQSPAIKMKNSGYFISHELQVKRNAARKAYLLSLEKKPKISFQGLKKMGPKSENKKVVPKKLIKSKKNIKQQIKDSDVLEEVQTIVSETNEVKDENIENVVDGLLEDLLRDAALDLNRIKERKKDNKSGIEKVKETLVPLTSCKRTTNNGLKITENDNSDVRNWKLSLGSSKKLIEQKSEDLKNVLVDGSISTFCTESVNTLKKTNKDANLCELNSDRITQSKFVCEISRVLTIDPRTVKNIIQNKDNFFKYLEKISRRVKGNFNPWILNEMLAETILNECIEDVTKELNEMPFNVIQDIYSKEFITLIE